MSELLFAPMFRVPFATGLLLAVVLPALGLYLRLRREWLAALGFAHLAAAGGVLATFLGVPALGAALGAAALGAVAKGIPRRADNSVYALFILLGWSAMLLGAANSYEGALLGQALVDGQLYFATRDHLAAALALAAATAVLLPRLSSGLLREEFFPGTEQANRRPVRRRAFCFDLLVAGTVALGALAVGIMAAFALLFLPAWAAWAVAARWRGAVALAVLLSVTAYVAAYVLAILLDQPFGPMLAATLLLLAPLRLLRYRHRGG